MKILQLLLCLVVLSPVRLMADAQISEWVGQYNMNHDGHLGTLLIRDLKLDCATSPWCSLLVRYTDANGTQFAGRIERVDQNSQHMVFVIDFPGNSQKFDVYLFSWDKNKMAGTTYWEGRTFGVFATKNLRLGIAAAARLPQGPQASNTPIRTAITSDGKLQIHNPDGSVKTKRPGQCGSTTTWPDGRSSSSVCSQVPRSDFPELPQQTAKWLQSHSDQLISVIQLLLPTKEDFENYRKNEGTLNLVDQIDQRTSLIQDLTAQ